MEVFIFIIALAFLILVVREFSDPHRDKQKNARAVIDPEAQRQKERVQNAILEAVDAENIEPYFEDLRFNFKKNEIPVYRCEGVGYYTVVRRSRIKGSSHGLSIRVAKGLWYRPSTFSAGTQSSESIEFVDIGVLAITNKHVYFVGESQRFRIPYQKIVSFEPFTDGFGIHKDGVRAKPQNFQTDDGPFLYDLVTRLSQMH